MKEITIYQSWDGIDFPSKELCEQYEQDNPPIPTVHEYLVYMKVSGYVNVTVEAENKEQAKEKAFNEFNPDNIIDFDVLEYVDISEIIPYKRERRIKNEKNIL